ncbi:hypothetical protein K6754_06285 [Vibrio alginolyticus]|uniref:hypothetical protein n=1 Tax=Vibrio alginolyticus TaxID=663 RepID=UPI001EF030EA|nr:hypothetical protein [Vibrio alginolyticus]EMC8465280.1 hypothetical protein [Vibrio alginolyticus]EME3939257.1 hypothetical protein [Vibrio alginolyticus]ULF92746.1 hypothetical protein K6754_06285 [Vibrio alginolyticus]
MPKFVGCLIGFHSWFVASLAGAKCGKSKFIGSSSSLVVLSVEFPEVKAQSLAEIHH